MTVITISRQYGSGGDEIADRVCEILGFQHFDIRLIMQAAAQVGLSSQEILDFSEESHKVVSFLDRILGRGSAGRQLRAWREDPNGMLIPENIVLSEEIMMDLVQKAIFSAHRAGNMVIIGRAGQVILRDEPDVLHVRVIAPMEDRIQRLKEQTKRTTQTYDADIEVRRAVQDKINERDASSADYIKRFYHVDWNDPMLYHLTINTGKVSIEQASAMVVMLARQLPVIEKAASV